MPLVSFCSGGAVSFKINSLTDKTSGSCAKMNLAMDATGKTFTANFPYPNLECIVKFKCDLGGDISTDIVAVTYNGGNACP